MYKFLLIVVLLLPSIAAAEQPFTETLAAAEAGDRAAMLATGAAYYRGSGVERDCYEARRWLKKSAAAGAVEAYYLLGTIDDDGNCGLAQAERAADNYRQAAEQGHAGARYRLGELYRSGRGVEQNGAAALKLLEAAAGQGEARAFCSLAQLYLKGEAVPASRQKALRWLRRGLASRNPEAVALCRELQAAAGL